MRQKPREDERIRKIAKDGTLAEFIEAIGIPMQRKDRLMLIALERMRKTVRRGGNIPQLNNQRRSGGWA